MSFAGSMPRNRGAAIAAGVLVATTLAVFWPITHHGFVNIDDTVYVTENPWVRGGLTWRGIAWAFSIDPATANWHPLTWFSHQADVTLFGLHPGRQHLVSLLFHAANAWLLFLVLLSLTAAPWRSILVAALFALHPLHVESVAWIAERKDVLSTFFLLLSLAAWLRHLRHPGATGRFAAAALFALSLMAKPMGVTFPFLLLLLDWWPLGRLRLPGSPAPPLGAMGGDAVPGARTRAVTPLVVEKIPLLALAVASAAVTWAAQSRGGAVMSGEAIPFGARLANAVVSYLAYLGKMLWPEHLAIYYPHPGGALPASRIVLAALLLAAGTAFALRRVRRHPWLASGWLWYAGMLLPVIGLVQVGAQAMADRYTYLPLVGIFVAVVWEAAGLAGAHPRLKPVALVLAVLIPAALARMTMAQVGRWRDNRALFGRALEVTSGNFQAHVGLGVALSKEGRLEEAVAHYREALRLHPGFLPALKNLSLDLSALGRIAEAERYAREAAGLAPDAAAHNILAMILENSGRPREAVEHYRAALRLRPDSSEFNNNLGVALAGLGEMRQAAEQFAKAVKLDPANESARGNLGKALEKLKGR